VKVSQLVESDELAVPEKQLVKVLEKDVFEEPQEKVKEPDVKE
jgi:hypothetical protein